MGLILSSLSLTLIMLGWEAEAKGLEESEADIHTSCHGGYVSS